jgi:hypothetical protein
MRVAEDHQPEQGVADDLGIAVLQAGDERRERLGGRA